MSSGWILLAEDNDDDLALALRVIRKVDPEIKVVTARDGEEALALLGLVPGKEAISTPPSLILLDLKMPRVTGIEALGEIRKSKSLGCVPVVMLTSSDEPTDVQQCYQNGANSYTVKPVDYDQFNLQMSSTIDYWLHINCLPQVSRATVGC